MIRKIDETDNGPGGSMTVSPGKSFPLGATVVDGGVNFCVFSRNAGAVELVLFEDHPTHGRPA